MNGAVKACCLLVLFLSIVVFRNNSRLYGAVLAFCRTSLLDQRKSAGVTVDLRDIVTREQLQHFLVAPGSEEKPSDLFGVDLSTELADLFQELGKSTSILWVQYSFGLVFA